jgi:hypothetical protein
VLLARPVLAALRSTDGASAPGGVHSRALLAPAAACFSCSRLTSLTLLYNSDNYHAGADVDVALPSSYPTLPSLTQLRLRGELGTETHTLALLAACPALQQVHLEGVYHSAYSQPATTIATLLPIGRLCRSLHRLQFQRFPYAFFFPSAEQLEQVSRYLSHSSLTTSTVAALLFPRLESLTLNFAETVTKADEATDDDGKRLRQSTSRSTWQ